MAKTAKQVTRVSVEYFLAIAKKLGATVSIKDVDKSGWYKVEGKTSGRKVYVPNQTEVGIVHLSGFTVSSIDGVVDFDGPTKMVQQAIDFSPGTNPTKCFADVLKGCLFGTEGITLELTRKGGSKKAATPPTQEEIDKALLAALGEEAGTEQKAASEPPKSEEALDAELDALTAPDAEEAVG
jgi:hypothetical protein